MNYKHYNPIIIVLLLGDISCLFESEYTSRAMLITRTMG